MEERGYEKAKKILEKLHYTNVKEIFPGKRNTKFPYDMVAVKGAERFLIEVKYGEENRSSSNFPVPWICRAYRVLTYLKEISESWKPLLLILAKRNDRWSYLLMEPRFTKPWFQCEFEEGKDYESVESMMPSWLKKYPSN